MTISTERLNILRQTFKATAKTSEALEAAALNDAATAISELLAVREAQPVFSNEIEGDDWINAGRLPGSTFDFNNLPDGINHLYAAPPAPALQQCFHDAIDDMENVMAWIMKLPVPTDGATAKAGRLKNSIAACRAAIHQPVSHAYTLPEGYKLVPVEPTENMVIDGFESEAWDALADAVLDKKGWPYSCRESAECVTGIFKAMTAAAPTPTN
ncbi:hypothetical protein [Serratia fonticola]|uniref:hypothetical protein n=1 Tax=Serratia fonticola TaxID=47917 RepID=UPI0027F7B955|nr:hypothetical protein [Serratia fonticola]MDQ7209067.1 hypothetical protein [Serratia fonticola]HBE9093411.1 hypothetical protein [Serratia fonticola]